LSFPASLKEAKIITLSKSDKDPKFTFDQLSVHYGQTFRETNLKKSPETYRQKKFSASRFGFRTSHRPAIHCIMLTDLVTLDFNNNMPTAAMFLDMRKAFDTSWHCGLIYKSSEL
jgi:ethanolamine utilization protein EutQ (cupin superfamily)